MDRNNKPECKFLVGLDKKLVETILKRSSKEFHEFIDKIENPYGDGKASERIIEYTRNENIKLFIKDINN